MKSVLVGIQPNACRVTDPPFALAVWGEGFQEPVLGPGLKLRASLVLLNGEPTATEWLDGMTLRCRVAPAQYGPGEILVRVRDPDGEETEYCVPLSIRP